MQLILFSWCYCEILEKESFINHLQEPSNHLNDIVL